MPRYWWPGFEMQLLGELQRQQNSSQYCDTLLQTEGISIPTHSCVLAALSPSLSQMLSATPSPPAGQQRQLHLQAVKAQTLLKLVGLLYCGEVEVKGHGEKNEVLAAAQQLGIARPVEGHGDFGTRNEEFLCRRWNYKRCKVGCRGSGLQDAQVQAEVAERGDDSAVVIRKSCVSAGTQTDENTEVCEQIEHSFPVPVQLTAQIVDVFVGPRPQNPTIAQDFSFSTCHPVPLDEATAYSRSPNAVTNLTSTPVQSHGSMTFPVSFEDGLNSAREDNVLQESLESEGGVQASVSEEAGPEDRGTDGSTVDTREGETSVDKAGNSAVKKPVRVAAGVKNVAKMRQLTETTHISIKVKLRRRTRGAVWEVVNMQHGEETLSVQTSMKQDRSRRSSPQNDLKEVRPPLPAVHLHSLGKPESWSLQTANTASSEQSERINSDSDSQPASSGHFALDSADGPDLEAQGSAEESDEQIERLLEDIMMGLNILPGLERGCRKSQRTDAGLQVGFAPQNQPGYRSSDSQQVQPSGALSCQNMSISESQASVYPEESANLISGGQKPDYTMFEQEDQRILELLPLSNGNETQPEGSSPLAFLDELRLPQCLSPLASCLPPAELQPVSGTSTDTDSQPKVFLRRRPWLAEKPGSLRFPFPTITDAENEDAPLPQEVDQSCGPERRQGLRETRSQFSTVNAVKESEVKPDPEKSKQNDTQVDSAAPKKRKTAHRRCPYANPCLAELKVSNGTTHVCSVNLSSNNVLVSGRKMASGSSTGPPARVDEQSKMSSVSKGSTENHRGYVRSRIRTRGFVRRSQQSSDDAVREPEPEVQRIEVVTERDPSLPKRGRGRPPKARQESSLGYPAVVDKSRDVGSHEESLPTDDQSGKTARGRKKRKMKKSEVEEVPLKKTVSAECTDDVVPDDARNLNTLKKPRTVSLMEFRKLVKRQHSKTRKSKEGPGSETPVSDGGREGTGEGDDRRTIAVEMETANPDDYRVGAQADVSLSSDSVTDGNASVFAEGRQESSSDICGKRFGTPSTERDESLMDAEEELTRQSDSTDATQETQTASGHHPSLQTAAEEAAPCLSGADGLIRTSSSPQENEEEEQEKEEEEEEEEEEEVDVLLCSPEKDPQISVCENGLDNVDVAPDEEKEEEEEEEEEIDVTGDEAE